MRAPTRSRPTSTPPKRAARYDRARDVPLLLPMWPADLADTSVEGRERFIALLRRALRAERARGLAGHWTYDLARHAQLRAALDAELALAAAAGPAPSRTHTEPERKKARW